MSRWCYVTGVIEVNPMGRTQEEKTYILETVLKHLPKVTGSEQDMHNYAFPKSGHNHSSNVDEFGNFSNTLPMKWHGRSFEMQDSYIVVVEGSLRDRCFKETYKEFIKWICRLAKRVVVHDVIVKIYDSWGESSIINESDAFYDMFESPSWSEESDGEPTWCEYLMWMPVKDERLPAILAYKYYNDEDNDKRVKNWLR